VERIVAGQMSQVFVDGSTIKKAAWLRWYERVALWVKKIV